METKTAKTYSKLNSNRIAKVWLEHKDKKSRFTETLVLFSSSSLFEDAIKEWEPSDVALTSTTCICSHHIENCYTYRNKINQSKLVIGSECINKFGNANMIKEHKLIKSDKEYTGSKRRCESCLKHRIGEDKPSYITKCKVCYKAQESVDEVYTKKYYRECSDCKQNLIPPTSERYIVKCTDCYKKNCRQCAKCKKNNIKATEPEWKKICVGCYIDSKK